MKIYEKPVAELISFRAEEIMNQEENFALYGHVGYSNVDTAAVAPDA